MGYGNEPTEVLQFDKQFPPWTNWAALAGINWLLLPHVPASNAHLPPVHAPSLPPRHPTKEACDEGAACSWPRSQRRP